MSVNCIVFENLKTYAIQPWSNLCSFQIVTLLLQFCRYFLVDVIFEVVIRFLTPFSGIRKAVDDKWDLLWVWNGKQHYSPWSDSYPKGFYSEVGVCQRFPHEMSDIQCLWVLVHGWCTFYGKREVELIHLSCKSHSGDLSTSVTKVILICPSRGSEQLICLSHKSHFSAWWTDHPKAYMSSTRKSLEGL